MAPQGPTATAWAPALCNQSSKLPISFPALFSPERQSCTYSDFSIIVNLQVIQLHLIKTERRN